MPEGNWETFGIVIEVLSRVLVGLILLVAGVAKLSAGKDKFLKAIDSYSLLPETVASLVARWLPVVEIGLAGLLLAGVMLTQTGIATFLLLIIFNAAIVSGLVRGKNIDCGCLGEARHTAWTGLGWRLVDRNLVLMFLTLIILATNETMNFSSSGPYMGSMPVGIRLSALLTAAWLAVFVSVYAIRYNILLKASTHEKRSSS